MPQLVVSLVIFVGLGAFFLFIHLLIGRAVRPLQLRRGQRPASEEDKLTIYECGEPTIGSAWVQFDLRYYVVALLFVIFDVEVAFFFPWATVFGKANTLALTSTPAEQRRELTSRLGITALPPTSDNEKKLFAALKDRGYSNELASEFKVLSPTQLAWTGFWDIMVFFGVLMVGFAYLWKRGDINWVRSVLGEQTPEIVQEFPESAESPAVVPAGTAKAETLSAAH
jgi:NADH-quinone oxidoreductase subunit A